MFDVPIAFPCWRYWASGESRLVASPAELDALPPGHEPWPGVFPQPWPPVTPPVVAPVPDASPVFEDYADDEIPPETLSVEQDVLLPLKRPRGRPRKVRL